MPKLPPKPPRPTRVPTAAEREHQARIAEVQRAAESERARREAAWSESEIDMPV